MRELGSRVHKRCMPTSLSLRVLNRSHRRTDIRRRQAGARQVRRHYSGSCVHAGLKVVARNAVLFSRRTRAVLPDRIRSVGCERNCKQQLDPHLHAAPPPSAYLYPKRHSPANPATAL